MAVIQVCVNMSGGFRRVGVFIFCQHFFNQDFFAESNFLPIGGNHNIISVSYVIKFRPGFSGIRGFIQHLALFGI